VIYSNFAVTTPLVAAPSFCLGTLYKRLIRAANIQTFSQIQHFTLKKDADCNICALKIITEERDVITAL
jgi:hypothetical protein